jgi:hypothetical protein
MGGRVPETIVNREVAERPVWRRKLASYRERFGG